VRGDVILRVMNRYFYPRPVRSPDSSQDEVQRRIGLIYSSSIPEHLVEPVYSGNEIKLRENRIRLTGYTVGTFRQFLPLASISHRSV
jgi:hypothetical protein